MRLAPIRKRTSRGARSPASPPFAATTRPAGEVARTRRDYYVSGVLKMLVQPPEERWTHVLQAFLGVVPFEKEDL